MKQHILIAMLASITLFGMDTHDILKQKLNKIVSQSSRKEFDKHQAAFAKTLEHPDINWAYQCCQQRLTKIEKKQQKHPTDALEIKKQNTIYILNALKDIMNEEFESDQGLQYNEKSDVYFECIPQRKPKH